MGLPRPLRKCFYCFEMDHLFLFCLKKTKDEKKELILVDKFMVRFTNREPIPMEHNMSIKDYVRKYLPLSFQSRRTTLEYVARYTSTDLKVLHELLYECCHVISLSLSTLLPLRILLFRGW